jgi:hypothetical protein
MCGMNVRIQVFVPPIINLLSIFRHEIEIFSRKFLFYTLNEEAASKNISQINLDTDQEVIQ